MLKNSFAIACLFSLAACGTENDDATPPPVVDPPATIEIAGEHCSNFGDTQTISVDSWRSVGEGYDSTYQVMSYSNEDNWAVIQNPADAEWDPSKFNAIVWTEPEDGVFYTCWAGVGFDAVDLINFEDLVFDISEPEIGGCGDFPWTKLALHCEVG